MTLYLSLLRGINVSGHKIIKMSELKQMFEEMGFHQVQTYIQSGNVWFESADAADTISRQIEHKIGEVFGYTVPVVIRTASELDLIIANCPFDAETLQEGESLYVALLSEAPSLEGIERLLSSSIEIDEYRITGREVYLLYRQSVRETKLTNNFLEKKLKVSATTRNWQTINKLADMGKAMKE